jgi:hypothetical protein
VGRHYRAAAGALEREAGEQSGQIDRARATLHDTRTQLSADPLLGQMVTRFDHKYPVGMPNTK